MRRRRRRIRRRKRMEEKHLVKFPQFDVSSVYARSIVPPGSTVNVKDVVFVGNVGGEVQTFQPVAPVAPVASAKDDGYQSPAAATEAPTMPVANAANDVVLPHRAPGPQPAPEVTPQKRAIHDP
eukprot:2476226-Pyramimonas_sp.AAC.1